MQKKLVFTLITFIIVINIKSSIVFCDDDDLSDFIQNNTENDVERIIFRNERNFGATTYILLDLLKNLEINNISDDCLKDIQRLEAAVDVREVWALKGNKEQLQRLPTLNLYIIIYYLKVTLV